MKSSLVNKPSQKQITISLDFDGVIKDVMTGEPVDGVYQALDWLISKGYILIISTANSDLEGVREWLKEHGINLPLTDKKVSATVYIDDRAIRFQSWRDVCAYF